jgi:hypothetical protein
MDIIETKHLFLSSANRTSGTSSSYTVSFLQDTLKCKKDEMLRLTLLQFNMYNNWNSVNGNNNTIIFTVGGTRYTVIIPQGNYNYYSLSLAIQNAYQGLTSVNYLSANNTFQYVFSTPTTISFPDDDSYKTFGFAEPGGIYTGTTITGDGYFRAGALDTIVLKVTGGATPASDHANLDNLTGEGMQISNILMLLPVTTPPWEELVYRNDLGNFSMVLGNKKIDHLSFQLISADDRTELLGINDHFFVLRVETLKQDKSMIDTLDEIKKLNHLQLMHQTLSSP